MSYRLREIEKKDLFIINQWRNDRDLIDFLGAPFRFINKDTDDCWYAAYLDDRKSSVRLALVEEDSDSIVGAVYLTSIDWLNRSAEFSIWIGSKDHQNKGLGKYASLQMLSHAFNDLGLQRIYLKVLKRNSRARELYKNIGFVEEGILRKVVFKNGFYEDMMLMSILAEEYKEFN